MLHSSQPGMRRLGQQEISRLHTQAASGGLGKATALTDCIAEGPDQLMFFEGDSLTLLSDSGDLLLAFFDGEVGWVKRSYVAFDSAALPSPSPSSPPSASLSSPISTDSSLNTPFDPGQDTQDTQDTIPTTLLTAPSPPIVHNKLPSESICTPSSGALDVSLSTAKVTAEARARRVSGPFELESYDRSIPTPPLEAKFSALRLDGLAPLLKQDTAQTDEKVSVVVDTKVHSSLPPDTPTNVQDRESGDGNGEGDTKIDRGQVPASSFHPFPAPSLPTSSPGTARISSPLSTSPSNSPPSGPGSGSGSGSGSSHLSTASAMSNSLSVYGRTPPHSAASTLGSEWDISGYYARDSLYEGRGASAYSGSSSALSGSSSVPRLDHHSPWPPFDSDHVETITSPHDQDDALRPNTQPNTQDMVPLTNRRSSAPLDIPGYYPATTLTPAPGPSGTQPLEHFTPPSSTEPISSPTATPVQRSTSLNLAAAPPARPPRRRPQALTLTRDNKVTPSVQHDETSSEERTSNEGEDTKVRDSIAAEDEREVSTRRGEADISTKVLESFSAIESERSIVAKRSSTSSTRDHNGDGADSSRRESSGEESSDAEGSGANSVTGLQLTNSPNGFGLGLGLPATIHENVTSNDSFPHLSADELSDESDLITPQPGFGAFSRTSASSFPNPGASGAQSSAGLLAAAPMDRTLSAPASNWASESTPTLASVSTLALEPAPVLLLPFNLSETLVQRRGIDPPTAVATTTVTPGPSEPAYGKFRQFSGQGTPSTPGSGDNSGSRRSVSNPATSVHQFDSPHLSPSLPEWHSPYHSSLAHGNSPRSPSSPHSVAATRSAVDVSRERQAHRGYTLVGRIDADLAAARGPVPITFSLGAHGPQGIQEIDGQYQASGQQAQVSGLQPVVTTASQAVGNTTSQHAPNETGTLPPRHGAIGLGLPSTLGHRSGGGAGDHGNGRGGSVSPNPSQLPRRATSPLVIAHDEREMRSRSPEDGEKQSQHRDQSPTQGQIRSQPHGHHRTGAISTSPRSPMYPQLYGAPNGATSDTNTGTRARAASSSTGLASEPSPAMSTPGMSFAPSTPVPSPPVRTPSSVPIPFYPDTLSPKSRSVQVLQGSASAAGNPTTTYPQSQQSAGYAPSTDDIDPTTSTQSPGNAMPEPAPRSTTPLASHARLASAMHAVSASHAMTALHAVSDHIQSQSHGQSNSDTREAKSIPGNSKVELPAQEQQRPPLGLGRARSRSFSAALAKAVGFGPRSTPPPTLSIDTSVPQQVSVTSPPVPAVPASSQSSSSSPATSGLPRASIGRRPSFMRKVSRAARVTSPEPTSPSGGLSPSGTGSLNGSTLSLSTNAANDDSTQSLTLPPLSAISTTFSFLGSSTSLLAGGPGATSSASASASTSTLNSSRKASASKTLPIPQPVSHRDFADPVVSADGLEFAIVQPRSKSKTAPYSSPLSQSQLQSPSQSQSHLHTSPLSFTLPLIHTSPHSLELSLSHDSELASSSEASSSRGESYEWSRAGSLSLAGSLQGSRAGSSRDMAREESFESGLRSNWHHTERKVSAPTLSTPVKNTFTSGSEAAPSSASALGPIPGSSAPSPSSYRPRPETDEWGFIMDISPTPAIYQSRLSPGDVRATEQKWLSIISTPLGHSPPSKRVRRLVIEAGVPASLRGRVWAWFMTAQMSARVSGLYQELLNHDKGMASEQIDRDVARVYADHSIFYEPNSPGQNDLRSLLRAFSNFAPSGYRRQMATLAGALLIHCVVEDAFWLLSGLINGVLKSYFSKDLAGMKIDCAVFAGLLHKVEPTVAKFLRDIGVHPRAFLEQWWPNLFIRSLPWPTVLRVFDAVIAEGPRFLLVASLAIVTISRDRILALPRDADTVIRYLGHLPQDNLLLPETFMRVCDGMKVKEDEVARLRRETEEAMRVKQEAMRGDES